MTQEDKQLLLKDISARLPYRVKIERTYVDYPTTLHEEDIVSWKIGEIEIKPYLRPMSSMTEEEEDEYMVARQKDIAEAYIHATPQNAIDWLNSHHFDYRGLIEKDLALEAPKDMYKTE